MREKKKIVAFIKAVKKEFFDEFINDGIICMNSLQTFRNGESNHSAIDDIFEGAVFASENNFKLSFLRNGELENANYIFENASNFRIIDKNEDGNILSLFAICDDEEIEGPLEFFHRFNEYRFCLIKNPKLFLDLLNAEIERTGYKAESYFVKYTIPNGEWSPFYKPEMFSYQNEYRVHFKNSSTEMKLFRIGSLKEFAHEILLV
jgi:hypothetical protein